MTDEKRDDSLPIYPATIKEIRREVDALGRFETIRMTDIFGRTAEMRISASEITAMGSGSGLAMRMYEERMRRTLASIPPPPLPPLVPSPSPGTKYFVIPERYGAFRDSLDSFGTGKEQALAALRDLTPLSAVPEVPYIVTSDWERPNQLVKALFGESMTDET